MAGMMSTPTPPVPPPPPRMPVPDDAAAQAARQRAQQQLLNSQGRSATDLTGGGLGGERPTYLGTPLGSNTSRG